MDVLISFRMYVGWTAEVEFHVEVCGEYEKTRKTMPVGKKTVELIPFLGPSANPKHQALTIWLLWGSIRSCGDDRELIIGRDKFPEFVGCFY